MEYNSRSSLWAESLSAKNKKIKENAAAVDAQSLNCGLLKLEKKCPGLTSSSFICDMLMRRQELVQVVNALGLTCIMSIVQADGNLNSVVM